MSGSITRVLSGAAAAALTVTAFTALTGFTAPTASAATTDHRCSTITNVYEPTAYPVLTLLGIDPADTEGLVGLTCTSQPGEATEGVQLYRLGDTTATYTCESVDDSFNGVVVIPRGCTVSPAAGTPTTTTPVAEPQTTPVAPQPAPAVPAQPAPVVPAPAVPAAPQPQPVAVPPPAPAAG